MGSGGRRGVSRSGLVAVCVLLTLCSGVAARGATAEIVPGESIRGVALGMTQAQVIATIRAPGGSDKQRASSGPGHHTLTWGFGPERLTVTFSSKRSLKGARVTAVTTTSSIDTVQGVGVGSTLAAVKTAIPRLSCDKPRPRFREFACRDRVERVGARVTQVYVRTATKRVTSIAVCHVVTKLQGFPLCYFP